MKRKHRHGPRRHKRSQVFQGLRPLKGVGAEIVIRDDAAPRLLASLRKAAKLVRNFNRMHAGTS